ncbi:MAG: YeiH family protein [Bacteroidales bacterium]|nr:YeiH family protein [Bacteroidales bacterium]
MKSWIKQFGSEDWIIVFAAAVVLLLAAFFPHVMPTMPSKLSSASDWLSAGYLFIFVYVLVMVTSAVLHKPLKGVFFSLLVVFALTLCAQLVASIPACKKLGFEAVFFAVIFGLIISNCFKIPEWMKPAIQSEFYIKIGIVCLGSTILFGEVMKSGAFGLVQAVLVVTCVWSFAFWVCRKMKVDPEMGTMISSAVSICGVSAAIATCGVINGDSKKLSSVVSMVLIASVPMMYLLPWIANLTHMNPELAGAWIGGTIDTTGAVAAAGALVKDTTGMNPDAGQIAGTTAVIVKSSQNVLLGIAAFIISLMWNRRMGAAGGQKPSAAMIWDRFPKFVVGFIVASLVFSLIAPGHEAYVKEVTGVTKNLQSSFFSLAFVCIGLETRFKELFGRENRNTLWAFLIAQTVNIFITLVIASVIFGWLKPAIMK